MSWRRLGLWGSNFDEKRSGGRSWTYVSQYQQILVLEKGRSAMPGHSVSSAKSSRTISRHAASPSGGMGMPVTGTEIWTVFPSPSTATWPSAAISAGSPFLSCWLSVSILSPFLFRVSCDSAGAFMSTQFRYPSPCLAIFNSLPRGGMTNIPLLMFMSTGLSSRRLCSASLRGMYARTCPVARARPGREIKEGVQAPVVRRTREAERCCCGSIEEETMTPVHRDLSLG